MSGRPLLVTLVAIALVAAAILAAPAIGSPSDLGSASARAVVEGGFPPPRSKDSDHDGLSNKVERRLQLNPRKADTDREGLTDSIELRRTNTNPRLPDTDGDALTDWTEVNRTHTNPRKADTDGDGVGDGDEVRLGTDPLNPTSIPPPPPAGPEGPVGVPPPPVTSEEPQTPPVTAIWSAPSDAWVGEQVPLDGSASTGGPPISCTWSFENETGSTIFEQRTGCRVDFTFISSGMKYVRLSVSDGSGGTDSSKQSFNVTQAPPPPPSPDTAAPDTTISSSPPAATTSTSASFSFSSTESGSTFACSLDGGAYGSCSSPKSYSGLALGSHSFAVRATDAAGNTDQTPATIAWTVQSTPLPPDTAAPDTTISSSPPATTTSTSASFSFSSTESGSTFACSLDGGAYGSCSSPKSYSSLALGSHSFAVRATDAAGNTDQTPATFAWTVEAPPPPPPSGCVSGATQATTTAQIRSAVGADNDVCVVADVGDVTLENLGSSPVAISTDSGGSMGHVLLKSTTGLTIRSARLRSVELRSAGSTSLIGNVIGGTQANRTFDQLIFAPDTSPNVTVEGNDIGWTRADGSGNSGYGCRCYGTLDNFRFVGNKVHDLAADGLQGFNGSNILIDRNEIGPVGQSPGSGEHSDNIQIVSNDSGMRVTNNWIHHQGYYEGQVTGNAGSTYIHGGSNGSLLYENNLIETNQGRTEVCGLGTGGTSRSNITIRNNTWIDGGKAFSGFPSFEWDCDSGTGNTVARNIAVDPDGGFAQDGSASAATFSANLFGNLSLVTFDANGNCTTSNCNPAGQEPIGYRKPSGVSW